MYKLGTRSYGYIPHNTSKKENFHLALKHGSFEEKWQRNMQKALGVKSYTNETLSLHNFCIQYPNHTFFGAVESS